MHHLLSVYPSLFLTDSLPVLPTVLERLVGFDEAARADAAVVLGGYALGLPSTDASAASISREAVRQFILKYLPTPSRSKPDANCRFKQLIERAMAGPEEGSSRTGPRWAIFVICSLTLLSGADVFLKGRRFCKLVLDTSSSLSRPKAKLHHDLKACLWRCLLWAYAQMPPHDYSQGPANPSVPTRENVLETVRQELNYGVGARLVGILLYAPSDPHLSSSSESVKKDITLAVSVLRDMAESQNEDVHADSVSILSRMVNVVENAADTISPSWNPSENPVRYLLRPDTFTLDSAKLSTTLRQANRFNPSIIRPLLEEDIQQQWAALLDIWRLCVIRVLGKPKFVCLPVCRVALRLRSSSLTCSSSIFWFKYGSRYFFPRHILPKSIDT